MALVVEDGTGRADAESYVSVAAADAYHLARGNATWTGTDAVKEQALRRAATYLDGRYRRRLPGQRRNGRVQALEWPRKYVVADDGSDIAFDEVPAELIAAACEAALRELVSPGSLSPDTVPARRVKSVSVGPIRREFFSDQRSSPADFRTVSPLIEELMAPLLLSNSSGQALMRA